MFFNGNKHVSTNTLLIFIGLLFIGLPFISTCEYFMSGTYAMITLFSLELLWLINTGIHRNSLTIRTIDLFFLAWICWCALKFFILNNYIPDRGILYEGIGLCIWYGILRLNHHTNMIISFCILSGTLQASIGILQYFGCINSNNIYFTFTGSFDNPGPLGGFLATTFLLTLPYAIYQWHSFSTWRKIAITFASTIQLYTIIGTNSRASWLAVLTGIIYFLGYYYFKKQYKKWIVLGYIVTLLTGIGLYYYRPDSGLGRVQIWQVSTKMFQEKPLTGLGIEAFPTQYMNFQADYFKEHHDIIKERLAGNNTFAFNEFIRIACEQGLIGLCLLCLLLTILFISPMKDYPGKIAQTSLTGFIVFSCFSYPAERLPLEIMFITLIAIITNHASTPTFSIHLKKRYKLQCCVILSICVIPIISEYFSRINIDRALHTLQKSGKQIQDSSLLTDYHKYIHCSNFILGYSHILFHSQKYDKALPVLEQAARLQPTSEILCDLGKCYVQQQEYDKAEYCFKQASFMVPAYLMPRYQLFCLYKEKGKKHLARSIAQEILNTSPKIVNSLTLDIKRIVKTWYKENIHNQKAS